MALVANRVVIVSISINNNNTSYPFTLVYYCLYPTSILLSRINEIIMKSTALLLLSLLSARQQSLAVAGSIKPSSNNNNNNNNDDKPKSNGRGGLISNNIDMSSLRGKKLQDETIITVVPMKGRPQRIFHGIKTTKISGGGGAAKRNSFYGESDAQDGSTLNLIECGHDDDDDNDGNPKICGSMNDITGSMIYNFRHDADGKPYVEETPYYMYPPEADPLPEPTAEEAPWKNDRRNLLRKKKRDAALNLNIPHPQQWKKKQNIK